MDDMLFMRQCSISCMTIAPIARVIELTKSRYSAAKAFRRMPLFPANPSANLVSSREPIRADHLIRGPQPNVTQHTIWSQAEDARGASSLRAPPTGKKKSIDTDGSRKFSAPSRNLNRRGVRSARKPVRSSTPVRSQEPHRSACGASSLVVPVADEPRARHGHGTVTTSGPKASLQPLWR